MTYLVTELITNAYYLSGIVGRDLETVSGDQLNDALRWLNALLTFKSVDVRLIPYYTRYNFNMVAQQKDYTIPNLIYAECITFSFDNVRYNMRENTRKEFWGSAQVFQTYTLPFNWNIERKLGGALLSFYFPPDKAYACELWGKFGLTTVTLQTDLDTVYDPFYEEYLKYALGAYICAEYAVVYPVQSQKQLDMYEEQLITVSPMDLSINKISAFSEGSFINYGDVNIGKGWRPNS